MNHPDPSVLTRPQYFEQLAFYKVKLIAIGGYAVGAHGFPRATTDNMTQEKTELLDYDLWYKPYIINYRMLLKALRKLGYDISRHDAEDFPVINKIYLQFKHADFNFDFVPKVSPFTSFDECWERAMPTGLYGCKFRVLSLPDLLLSKASAGRPKDLIDIAELKRIHNLP